MALLGKDAIVAVEPTAWGTGVAVGAGDGLYVTSLDPVVLKGEIDFDNSSGLSGRTNYQKTQDNANMTVVMPMRWRGYMWTFLVHWIGTDVNTGANPYTHTMSLTQVPALAAADEAICMAWQLDNSQANTVAENPSLRPQSISLEPDAGFWNMTANCIGYTIYAAGESLVTNTSTELGNVTYVTAAERMRFKANGLWKNAQGGGAVSTSDAVTDLTNMVVTLDRPYDEMKDVLLNSSALDATGALPIQNDDLTVTLSYDQKTYDYATHRSDLASGNEYKSEIVMTETVGGTASTFSMEFPKMIPTDPQVALERGQRIPMTHNYDCVRAASAPTGHTNANEMHCVLVNGQNLGYDTNA